MAGNYRLEDASFALDLVEGLGTFVEIEIMAEKTVPIQPGKLSIPKEMGIPTTISPNLSKYPPCAEQ